MRVSYFSKDVQEFLKLLAAHKVKYLIVGGEAVIYHGYARLTGDVDFFCPLDSETSNPANVPLTTQTAMYDRKDLIVENR